MRAVDEMSPLTAEQTAALEAIAAGRPHRTADRSTMRRLVRGGLVDADGEGNTWPTPAGLHLLKAAGRTAAKMGEVEALARDDWPERLKEIIRDDSLLDKMTSADLKRAGKMLVRVIKLVGQRAGEAEAALLEAPKADDATLSKDLDRVTYRNLVLTGGRPPAWSYLHREAVELLHEYAGFETRKSSKGWQVVGMDAAGKAHPLYDFDYAGLGVTQSASEARLMTAHLRQSFHPRNEAKHEGDN